MESHVGIVQRPLLCRKGVCVYAASAKERRFPIDCCDCAVITTVFFVFTMHEGMSYMTPSCSAAIFMPVAERRLRIPPCKLHFHASDLGIGEEQIERAMCVFAWPVPFPYEPSQRLYRLASMRLSLSTENTLAAVTHDPCVTPRGLGKPV